MTSDGDYVFGLNAAGFFVNTPEAVGQAILTRLRLNRGEWFLDTSEGVPYQDEVFGFRTSAYYDMAIREAIASTQGVNQISAYSSQLNPETRVLTISATVDTIYGQTEVTVTL